MAAPAVPYLVYLLLDSFVRPRSWRDIWWGGDLVRLPPSSPPQVLLLIVAAVVQAAIFYVAVTRMSCPP